MFNSANALMNMIKITQVILNKKFNANSELAALKHILSNCGSMFNITTHISRLLSILLWYFDLIAATAEKRVLRQFIEGHLIETTFDQNDI